MKIKPYLLLCLLAVLVLPACKKHSIQKPGTANIKMDSDVYVTGRISIQDVNSGQYHPVAVYWKNGVLTRLTDSTESWEATGITAYNGKVYIPGDQTVSATNVTPVYWEISASGGVIKHDVPSTAAINYTFGIGANKDGVYVVGRTNEGTATSNRAVYWKDGGNAQSLPIPTTSATSSYGNGIYAIDHDVYIAGYINGSSGISAAYWKNGELIKSGDGLNSYALAILFDGTHVYTAGGENNQATFWEDKGNSVSLPVNGSASSSIYAIAVSNKMLYAAGSIKDASNNATGAYWTNATPLKITTITGSEELDAIAAIGNNVYIAGHMLTGPPAYWINNTMNPLAMPANARSHDIKGIAVLIHPHNW